MITYLRMSSAWHKGNGPVPRSLAGDGEVGAGGQGLPDVPGHAFGPAPPPVDQHHDGGQARPVTTTRTESAFLRGWKRSPARQPGERVIGVMCVLQPISYSWLDYTLLPSLLPTGMPPFGSPPELGAATARAIIKI
jgi:hypothetical protein